jgi:hypothetical protein
MKKMLDFYPIDQAPYHFYKNKEGEKLHIAMKGSGFDKLRIYCIDFDESVNLDGFKALEILEYPTGEHIMDIDFSKGKKKQNSSASNIYFDEKFKTINLTGRDTIVVNLLGDLKDVTFKCRLTCQFGPPFQEDIHPWKKD